MRKERFLRVGLLLSLATLLLSSVFTPVGAATGYVVTSQLGFAPGDVKVAVLAVPTGTPLPEQTFRVVEVNTGQVHTGTPRRYPGGWYGNNGTGDTYLLDFSGLTTPGHYVVESNGLPPSRPFEIGDNVYDVRRVKPLEFFRIQQSSVGVSWRSLDGTTGGHPADHLDDARQATRRDGGGDDPKLIEQDYLQLPNGQLPVAGGWFDAGDYNKYMGNTPWAAYLLLLTYEEHQPYWSAVNNNGDGQPDLLDYVRPALDWMLSMQHLDGSVFERVFNGYTAPFDGRPDLETDNNPLTNADNRPLDTDRYADITAKSSYAMAAAYRVFRLQKYLDMAVKAWDWAYANQGTVKAKRYGGGLYFGDVEIGLTLGAVELHRAQIAAGLTPDPKYLKYATEHVQKHLAANDWIEPSSWDYQKSYALVRYYDLASIGDKTQITNQLKGRWDAGIRYQSANAYRMNDEWLYGDFGQNDLSASSAGDALWLFKTTGETKYREYAVNQMAWIFGRNPFGESWLSSASVGEYTRISHWRVTAKHPIEGVVVPGATDRDRNRKPDYTDTGEWYYSEPTINQQAMFVRVMTALHFAAGGSSGPPPTDSPPMVSITSQTEGAVISGTIAVQVNASDDSGVDTVAYQVDSGNQVLMDRVSGTAKSGTWRKELNTNSLSDGLHRITVVATDTARQQASSSIDVSVNNGQMPLLHIGDIQAELVHKGNSPKIQARSVTLILDAFDRPVPAATVKGHWEGSATDSFTSTTDSNGTVTDYSNSAEINGGVTFTWVVDGVTKDNWIWDTSRPQKTSATISGP